MALPLLPPPLLPPPLLPPLPPLLHVQARSPFVVRVVSRRSSSKLCVAPRADMRASFPGPNPADRALLWRPPLVPPPPPHSSLSALPLSLPPLPLPFLLLPPPPPTHPQQQQQQHSGHRSVVGHTAVVVARVAVSMAAVGAVAVSVVVARCRPRNHVIVMSPSR
jgi:hypothetical protein